MTSQLSQPKREQRPDASDRRDDRSWFQRRLGWIGLLVLLIAGGVFLNMNHLKGEADSNDKDKLVVSGRIESDESHIGARLPSEVSEVYVKEGQTVHKGQLLIALDSSDLAARMRAADAGVSLA